MTILVIDNNKERLAQTSGILRRLFANDSILEQQDPLGAVRYLCHNPVDMMFAALEMRPMDGIQLAQTVKKVRRNMKVYITSGPKSLEEEMLFEDEADGFLSDPLTEHNLKLVLSGKMICL